MRQIRPGVRVSFKRETLTLCQNPDSAGSNSTHLVTVMHCHDANVSCHVMSCHVMSKCHVGDVNRSGQSKGRCADIPRCSLWMYARLAGTIASRDTARQVCQSQCCGHSMYHIVINLESAVCFITMQTNTSSNVAFT